MERTLKLNNIKCNGCSNSIRNAILKIEGIQAIDVNVDEGEIQIDASNEEVLEEAKKMLDKMGYPEADPTLLQNAKSYVSCMIGRISKPIDQDQ